MWYARIIIKSHFVFMYTNRRIWKLVHSENQKIVSKEFVLEPRLHHLLNFDNLDGRINKEFLANGLTSVSVLVMKY